jgi:four helix bundle protein
MVVIAMPAHGSRSASYRMRDVRHLDISIKSANATEYHLLDGHDLGLISEADWRRYAAETIEVRKMIYAYREAILRDERGPQEDSSADNGPLG